MNCTEVEHTAPSKVMTTPSELTARAVPMVPATITQVATTCSAVPPATRSALHEVGATFTSSETRQPRPGCTCSGQHEIRGV
eukprot:scaffold84226_cov57-Phaeocystis_antarctica.AAC.3